MVDLLLRFRSAVLAVLLVAGAAVMPSSRALADDAADIDRMAQSTLETLYAQKPSAARAVREAAGYAVFSDISTKILLAGGGGGKGVAVDNRSGAKTYMLMATVSAGRVASGSGGSVREERVRKCAGAAANPLRDGPSVLRPPPDAGAAPPRAPAPEAAGGGRTMPAPRPAWCPPRPSQGDET